MLTQLTFPLLEQILDESCIGKITKEACITQISIDSRQLLHPEQTLFVALKGAKADGITFVASLIEAGVRCFLVDKNAVLHASWLEKACFLPVGDTRAALQSLASYQGGICQTHRRHHR